MPVALETYQSAGKHLADPQSLLKDESFYRKHTVSCGVCGVSEGIRGEEGGGNLQINIPAHIIPVPLMTLSRAGVCVL